MNKFKYLLGVLCAAILAGVVIVACNSKDDDPDPAEEGKKAGTEMCGCVSDIPEPSLPEHPSSPLPPEGFDPQNPDLTDPATLAYLSDSTITAYFKAIEDAYNNYFGQLGSCAGVVANKYQKYFLFNIGNYDVEGGLFSAFDFKDEDFKNGFLETSMVCAASFAFE